MSLFPQSSSGKSLKPNTEPPKSQADSVVLEEVNKEVEEVTKKESLQDKSKNEKVVEVQNASQKTEEISEEAENIEDADSLVQVHNTLNEAKDPNDFVFPTSVRIVDTHLTKQEESLLLDDEYSEDIPTLENEVFVLTEADKKMLDQVDEALIEEYATEKNRGGGLSLDELLDLALDKESSDIHIAEGEKIYLRVHGVIYPIENISPLTALQCQGLVFALVQNPLLRHKLLQDRELDASYTHKNGMNFRVNIFFKRGRLSAVLRTIASQVNSLEALGIPDAMKRLIQAKQGLILVTGPTSSGKSTSLQAILQHINESRIEHILTIEDPIEFIFTNKKSIFSQREVGRDTLSFSQALRASLREDPDVIMIGELRDKETIDSAMKLAETGHLVFSTLHTSSAAQTLNRIVSYYSAEEQAQVQSRLSDSLLGVLSQRLVSRSDGSGRVGLYELLIANSAVRNVVRQGEFEQIPNTMLSGRDIGMVSMKDYAEQLEFQDIITRESYIHFFKEDS